MKWISKSARVSATRLAGALALIAAAEGIALGRALPHFVIEHTPVNRQTTGVTSYAPIVKRAEPSVVTIYSTRTRRFRPMQNPFFNDPFFRQFFGGGDNRVITRKEQSLGSGVIISSDGYILTANHVIAGADPQGVKVALTAEGEEYTAQIIGTDPPTDVALLKIDATNLPAIVQADSDQLQVGDVVLAIGNPFAVGRTVTMGIVSALGRSGMALSQYEDFIQTDAAINPGNSGGALVDAEGRLVGINTAIVTASGGYEGIGFAVPVNLARSVVERLIQYGKVTRGFLGVGLQTEITHSLAEEFQLPDQRGALVAEVLPDTPAAKAGLRSGDVIRAVNGKKVADRQQLQLTIAEMAPGTTVSLEILRSAPGEKPAQKTLDVTLGALPSRLAEGRRAPAEEKPPQVTRRDSLAGVEVQDLDPDARQQLRIPGRIQGALVTRVESGSNAADAGLQPGDVIVEINREPVRDADDAVALSKKAKGDRVLLRVWRDGTSFYVTVKNTPNPP